jgi:hypothetical protein
MLTAFFYAKGIIHHEFVLEKQTVNNKFYKEVIKILITRVHCIRPEFQESGSCIFYTTMHQQILRALSLKCLAKRGIPMLLHPPYSADLMPADFFLFPKLKAAMKGTRFKDVSSIQKTVT